MYTKTGRECNLTKRIYRNGTKQNMSKHTCLFQARSAACPFTLYRGFFTPQNRPCTSKIVGTFYMQEKTAIVPPVSKLSGHPGSG